MKRKILLGIVLGTILLFMTGCCIQHEWVAADCVEPQTCNKCGRTEGDALGHKWEEATCISAKTCIVCGETEGDFADHKWKDATCANVKTCTVCSKKEGEMLEHKWQAATCETPQTCVRCGQTNGNVAAHKWSEATCQNPKTCTMCGKTEGEVTEHNWKTATCVAPKTCTWCGITSGSASGEHRLNTKGKCMDCNKQIGTELSILNNNQYLSADVSVTSKDSKGFIQQVLVTVRSKRSNAKFYNAEVKVTCKAGYDGKVHVPYTGTMQWNVKLDENGYGFLVQDYDTSKNLVSRPLYTYIKSPSLSATGVVVE